MPAHRKPTITDLAKACGFSRGSISRAFNDQAEVSEETKKRIFAVAARIGYVPHPGARLIKGGRTRRIGVLFREFDNPYYPELIDCLDVEAKKRGNSILLMLSRSSPKVEHDFLLHCSSGETDGIVIDSVCYDDNFALFKRVQKQGFPTVFLHGAPLGGGFDLVRYDLYRATCDAIDCLVAAGHRRIAYLVPSRGWVAVAERRKAYEHILQAHGIALDGALVSKRLIDTSPAMVERAWDQWRRSGDPPTAVVCWNDRTAVELYRLAKSQGVRIPEDLSIVGVDNIHPAHWMGLSTIETRRAFVAETVHDLLENRMEKPGRPREIREIQGEFLPRTTHGPVSGVAGKRGG